MHKKKLILMSLAAALTVALSSCGTGSTVAVPEPGGQLGAPISAKGPSDNTAASVLSLTSLGQTSTGKLSAQALTRVAGEGQSFAVPAGGARAYYNSATTTESAQRFLNAGGYMCNAGTFGYTIANASCFLESAATQTIDPGITSLAPSWGAEWNAQVNAIYFSTQMGYVGADPVRPGRSLYAIGYYPTTAEYNTARNYLINTGTPASAYYLAPNYSRILWVIYKSRTAVSSSGNVGFYGWDFYVH